MSLPQKKFQLEDFLWRPLGLGHWVKEGAAEILFKMWSNKIKILLSLSILKSKWFEISKIFERKESEEVGNLKPVRSHLK